MGSQGGCFYGIQNPVTFCVIKLPVLCIANLQQLRANLASQREQANGILKLREYFRDHRAGFEVNATERVRY